MAVTMKYCNSEVAVTVIAKIIEAAIIVESIHSYGSCNSDSFVTV